MYSKLWLGRLAAASNSVAWLLVCCTNTGWCGLAALHRQFEIIGKWLRARRPSHVSHDPFA